MQPSIPVFCLTIDGNEHGESKIIQSVIDVTVICGLCFVWMLSQSKHLQRLPLNSLDHDSSQFSAVCLSWISPCPFWHNFLCSLSIKVDHFDESSILNQHIPSITCYSVCMTVWNGRQTAPWWIYTEIRCRGQRGQWWSLRSGWRGTDRSATPGVLCEIEPS